MKALNSAGIFSLPRSSSLAFGLPLNPISESSQDAVPPAASFEVDESPPGSSSGISFTFLLSPGFTGGWKSTKVAPKMAHLAPDRPSMRETDSAALVEKEPRGKAADAGFTGTCPAVARDTIYSESLSAAYYG